MTKSIGATSTEKNTSTSSSSNYSTHRVKTGRGFLIASGASILAILAGAVGWNVLSWSKSARAAADVEKYSVIARDFTVSLQEKGELQAAKSTEIVCGVEGRSTIISIVSEGTDVNGGDLLVELASDQIEDRIRSEELKESNSITAYEAAKTDRDIQKDQNASDIRKSHLKIELAQLALDKYAKGDWTQSIKDAQIAIEQAKINLDRRAEDFESAKQLIERGFMTKTQFNTDEFNYQKAQWDLEKAKKSKEVLETYTHVAELRQRESDLEEAQKESERVAKNAKAMELRKERDLVGKKKELELVQEQLAKFRTQKEKCRIYAPTQGFVVYYAGGGRGHFMSSDSQIREGATVHERQIIMTLPDTSQMIVLVRVHEAKTDKLHLGQSAIIRVEAMPDHRFTGTVTKIAAVADSQNRWLNPDLKEYETEITLDPTDAKLKPGVTAHVEIMVEQVQQVLAVPVQSVYTKGGRRYVFKNEGRDILPTEIKVGAIGTVWAQVNEGLHPQDSILLAFGDNHKRLVPDLPPLSQPKPKMTKRSADKQSSMTQNAAKMMRGKGSGGKRPGGTPGMKRKNRSSDSKSGPKKSLHGSGASHRPVSSGTD